MTLPRSPAEKTEELEQLRALENGYRIRAAEIEGWTSVPVDVPEDVPIVEAALARQVAHESTPDTKGPEHSMSVRRSPPIPSVNGDDVIRIGDAGAPRTNVGALNFITPGKRILAATALPRRGEVISCGLNFDHKGTANRQRRPAQPDSRHAPGWR